MALALVAGACGGDEPVAARRPCPPRMVRLADPDVCIDRFEADDRGVSERGQLPARRVSFLEAEQRCRALGHRLCTGREWTRACAGRDATRKLPYGDTYERDRCNTHDAYEAEPPVGTAPPTPLAAGSRARCVTPEGVHDLSGNVWEWTDEPDGTGNLRELRGGGFGVGERQSVCQPDDRSFQPLDAAFDGYGFRCCTDPRR